MAKTNYAESWKDIYQNYVGTVNFVAGDFETLKSAIRQYIVNQIPENYTDFSDASEVGMFSNSIAYLGENIHYRVDLSVHNLFPQTTEKKQSLIDFAKMLSYFPNRNSSALGLAKLVAVSTTEDVEDSLGNSLANQTIRWDDNTNENWQEQFITIINAALSSNCTFGKPKKIDQVGNIVTQTYQMNNISNSSCIYPFYCSINDNSTHFEVVNSDIDLSSNELYEQTPIAENAFQLLYRNDGAGNGSINTGFFVMWKQGTLINYPYTFNEKVKNARIDIDDSNINNNDVWFAEYDQTTGLTTNVWTKIDKGEYLSYNLRSTTNKNLFKVETRADDKITAVFGDGNFANIPYGNYYLWARTTNSNDGLYIKPSDMQNKAITIEYKSQNSLDSNIYKITLFFSVVDFSHIRQSTLSESLETIRKSAPEVYSTQDRMVSNKDYNNYPLVAGDDIVVLKSLLRTYAGNSRYLPLNDNTGTYSGVNMVGKDGYLYAHTTKSEVSIPITGKTNITQLIIDTLKSKLVKFELANLYFDMYDGVMVPGNVNDTFKWYTTNLHGATTCGGIFKHGEGVEESLVNYTTVVSFFHPGDAVCFQASDGTILWSSIQTITGDELSYEVQISPIPDTKKTWVVRQYDAETSTLWSKINNFESTFDSDIIEEIEELISAPQMFGLTFDNVNRTWLIANDLSDEVKMVYYDGEDTNTRIKTLNWFFRISYNNPTQTWLIETRERNYVFGSNGETSFYFDTSKITPEGYFLTKDYIKVLGLNNKEYNWRPYDSFVYSDGYINPSRFKARAYDFVSSLNLLNPMQFKEMTNGETKKIIFEADTDTTVGNKIDFVDRFKDGIDGSLWECTTTSGYYYCKYKINKIIPAGVELEEPVNSPINYTGTTVLSNGTTQIFNGGKFINKLYDYDIVDYIKEYAVDESGNKYPVYYGEEGYLYDYDAYTHTLTEVDKNTIVVEDGLVDLMYLWVHYPNSEHVVDPASSNLIDMYALTTAYYNEVQNWISNGKVDAFPNAPTETELLSMFSYMSEKKMLSDTLIWHPVIYKLLFGYGASTRNQCLFKVVKTNELTSDNEIKQLVIRLIDEYFKTLHVGETYYFTKLSSFIHKNCNGLINSIVPVSANNTDEFGSLFEIGCEDNELLLSTASLDNIQIISGINSETINIK